MPGTPERDSFDITKQYRKVLFIQQRPVLDFELNELEDILETDRCDDLSGLFGTGPLGDSFKILPGLVSHEFNVQKGLMYYKGEVLRLASDVQKAGLPVPGVNVTYVVYIDFIDTQIDAAVDPNIVSPTIGAETANRIKRYVTVGYTIGAPIPQPPAGTTRFRIGLINRLAGNPDITTAMIVDERKLLRQTYVRSGGRAYLDPVAFDFDLEACTGKAGGNDFSLAPVVITVPPATALYYWVDTAGALQVGAFIPVDNFNCPLYYVTTDGAGITGLFDLRLQASEYQVVTDDIDICRGPYVDFYTAWLTEHNPDGTHAPGAAIAGSITKADVVDLKVEETAPQSMSLYVNPGTDINVEGFSKVVFAGGNVGPFVPPAFDRRIDLVCLDKFGVVSILQGTVISPAPTPPSYPPDMQVLAEVEVRFGDVVLTDARITDVRPWLTTKATAFTLKGSRHVFSYGALSKTYRIPVVAAAGIVVYTHNLGCMPLIEVLDVAGVPVVPAAASPTYISINQFSVDYGVGPFTGTIVVSHGHLHDVNSYLVTGVGAPNSSGVVQPFAGKIERISYSFATAPSGATAERVRVYLDSVATAVFFDISNATATSAVLDFSALNVRFSEGQSLQVFIQQAGALIFESSTALQIHITVQYDAWPYAGPPLYEVQIVPPAVPAVYTMGTGSFEMGDHSLAVYRNGKRLIFGTEYVETSTTKVTFLIGLVVGDQLLFEVPVIRSDGSTNPGLYEIYIAPVAQLDIPVGDVYRKDNVSLRTYRNGKRMLPTLEYIELTNDTIRLLAPCALGDNFLFEMY